LSLAALLLVGFLPSRPCVAQEPEVRRDIVYAKRSWQELKLDLYIPKGKGPHPLAVGFHGGGWRSGKNSSTDIVAILKLLAKEGIAGATAGYRLAPGAIWPAQIEACRRSLQFLREHAL
jgi:acetyl esterase/lipase